VAETSKVIELFEFLHVSIGAAVTTTMMIMAPPAIMMVALRA
jgi:hypothetical protein